MAAITQKLLPAIVLFLKSIHEYCFVVVSPSDIRSKYNSHVYDANTVVINTIYRCVLSVLLAELHSYAYTGHCSHARVCMCIDCIIKKGIEERLELSIL